MSRPTQASIRPVATSFVYATLTLCGVASQPLPLDNLLLRTCAPYTRNNTSLLPCESNAIWAYTSTVWTLPVSLATTQGI